MPCALCSCGQSAAVSAGQEGMQMGDALGLCLVWGTSSHHRQKQGGAGKHESQPAVAEGLAGCHLAVQAVWYW